MFDDVKDWLPVLGVLAAALIAGLAASVGHVLLRQTGRETSQTGRQVGELQAMTGRLQTQLETLSTEVGLFKSLYDGATKRIDQQQVEIGESRAAHQQTAAALRESAEAHRRCEERVARLEALERERHEGQHGASHDSHS